jgi:hypothetical protein
LGTISSGEEHIQSKKKKKKEKNYETKAVTWPGQQPIMTTMPLLCTKSAIMHH